MISRDGDKFLKSLWDNFSSLHLSLNVNSFFLCMLCTIKGDEYKKTVQYMHPRISAQFFSISISCQYNPTIRMSGPS